MTIPAAFIGHGSPMNALEVNRFTTMWSEFAQSMERPRAILAISAHWFINATAVTSQSRPRIIHDFYGFPQELSQFEYPVDGSPDLAKQVAELVEPTWVGLDQDSWGIDHGTWSVLAHAFPSADVPVVQLAIDANKPLAYHLELGSKLAPLMDDGVWIMASGNVVHNLRAIDWNNPDGGFDWAQRFDDDARQLMLETPAELGALQESDDWRLAVPTTDHFLPLAYIAGIAAASGKSTDVLIDGCTMGSLSMTAYGVGINHAA
ncbi:MAG: 4,5-DOPA dioxygenase extradiol [Actinomycetota bacterium]